MVSMTIYKIIIQKFEHGKETLDLKFRVDKKQFEKIKDIL